MYRFPEEYYTDIRIKDVNETKIEFLDGDIKSRKMRKYEGAFIRIFDG